MRFDIQAQLRLFSFLIRKKTQSGFVFRMMGRALMS